MTSLIRCRDLSQPGFRALSRDSCLPLQGQFDQLLKNPDYTGAADKAVNLVGCKSPHHQLPVRVVSISDACGGNEACSARM